MDFVKFVTLILIQASYPILAIVGGGLGCYFILNRWFHFKWRYTEIFHFSIITGCFFLIVPWVFIGIQPDGLLEISIIEDLIVFALPFATYVILCFGILLFLGLYASYRMIKLFIQKLENFEWEIIRKELTFDVLLIILLISEYIVLQLILPLRGFDALYIYFPEAQVFYLTDQITEINYLSFAPVFKAPFNVMLFTFSLYISQQQTFQLYPILFLIGSSLLAYDLSFELWGEKIKARLAMLVFLVTPVVYWTMTLWSYYQDLYVCYFFGAAFYFAWKGINQRGKNCVFFILPAILSMALALLSKINAWPLFIVLVLALPVKRWGRLLQLLILIVFTSFLIARSITNIFIGTGLVILLFAIFLGYIIIKRPNSDTKISLPSLIVFIAGSILLGGFWLIDRLNRSSEFVEEITKLYITVLDSIIWEFNGSSTYTFDLILERMQAVNFWSASIFFFIGIAFCLPWIAPKILALIRGTEIAPISTWVLIFFMIWMTYYFQGSIRYLSPIYIPLATLIVHGFHSMLKLFNVSMESKLPRAALLFFGCANFYFLIPLKLVVLGNKSQELVGNAYNRSAFSYYSQPELALIQALIFTLIWIGILVLSSDKPNKFHSFVIKIFQERNITFPTTQIHRIRYGISVILLLTVTLVPIAVQGYILLQSSGDLETFQKITEYEYNEDYQGIVEEIIRNGSATGGVITVRMPGMQFFTQRPALDFYYQSDLLGNQFYDSENISYLVEILKNPVQYLLPSDYALSLPFNLTFEFVVVPNTRNIYYDIYMEQVYTKSIFFQSLSNTTYFDLLHFNDRYRLFKIL